MISTLINYAVTGANTFKNWDFITGTAPTELSVEKYYRFWLFNKIFMNHIKNMGWLTYLIFTKSGTGNNTRKDFSQVKLEKIETEYQALELSLSPIVSTTKLNSRVSTLGSSTQATNRLKISLPKKVTIIID